MRGREPGLELDLQGKSVSFRQWADEILREIEPLAAQVDAELGGGAYAAAIHEIAQRVAEPAATPSARVLSAMARNHDNAFVPFVLVESMLHKAALKALELPKEAREYFARLADESLLKQRDLEATDESDFETFRQRYLSYDQLKV